MSESQGFPLGTVLKTAIWAAVADKITLPSYLRCAELLARHGESFVNSDAVITALVRMSWLVRCGEKQPFKTNATMFFLENVHALLTDIRQQGPSL